MAETTTQSSDVYDFLAWLDVNKKRVITGLIVAGVVGAAVGIYLWQKTETEIKANEALLALPSGLAHNAATQPKAEDYKKVADQYPSSSAAERAELMAASTYFNQGEYAKAKDGFEKFIGSYPESDLKPQASYGVAATLEAMGNWDQATAKYKELAQQYRGQSVGTRANLSLARIYESQKKFDEALKIYSDMDAPNAPQDMARAEAVERREWLMSEHPELRKVATPQAQEQILEVTTPPEGSTNAPQIKVVTPGQTDKK